MPPTPPLLGIDQRHDLNPAAAVRKPLCGQQRMFSTTARPGAAAELAQQFAIETRVQSKAFRDRQHELPVCDGRADLFGDVDGRQQSPFSGGRRGTCDDW